MVDLCCRWLPWLTDKGTVAVEPRSAWCDMISVMTHTADPIQSCHWHMVNRRQVSLWWRCWMTPPTSPTSTDGWTIMVELKLCRLKPLIQPWFAGFLKFCSHVNWAASNLTDTGRRLPVYTPTLAARCRGSCCYGADGLTCSLFVLSSNERYKPTFGEFNSRNSSHCDARTCTAQLFFLWLGLHSVHDCIAGAGVLMLMHPGGWNVDL